MASELQADYLADKTVYFQLRDATGSIWNGTSFVAYATADIADYDVAATEQGTSSGYYAGNMPSVNAGLYYAVAKERVGAGPAETDPTVGTGDILWNGTEAEGITYQAKVWVIDDNTAAVDRYMVAFYRNGQPVTSGITSPTIWVYRNTGADLIATSAAPQALTEIGTTGTYTYNESTNRLVDGAAYFARVRGSIDGTARGWFQPVGRDS